LRFFHTRITNKMMELFVLNAPTERSFARGTPRGKDTILEFSYSFAK
jgi:hypothetical protein